MPRPPPRISRPSAQEHANELAAAKAEACRDGETGPRRSAHAWSTRRATSARLPAPASSSALVVHTAGQTVARSRKSGVALVVEGKGPDRVPSSLAGDAEAAEVWQAMTRIKAAQVVATEEVRGWRFSYHLRGARTGEGYFKVFPPDWSPIEHLRTDAPLVNGARDGHKGVIRSRQALHDFLLLRVEARRGIYWDPPAVGDLVWVHVQDETRAGVVFEWRAAEVRRVASELAGRFMVTVHRRDGTPDEEFTEWYWKDSEGEEWARTEADAAAAAATAATAAAATPSAPPPPPPLPRRPPPLPPSPPPRRPHRCC